MNHAMIRILTALMLASPAWASTYTARVAPPSGNDDTANIQKALDTCAVHGPGCVVQLAAGTYHTRQLVAYNFHGTVRGIATDRTTIEALPNLPVTVDFSQPCLPNTTTCLWPTLVIFIDGDISLSSFSLHMGATDGTATAPWPGSGAGATYIETGIRFMGQRSTTNVHVDGFEEEGLPDSTSPYGFNVTNGVMYTGELSASSANPLDSLCGAPGGFYFVSGIFTVTNSAFKNMFDGVSQDGCVRASHVVIGGSPTTGNTFRGLAVGLDLESAENSDFEVSYNEISATGNSMWVVPWFDVVFVPTKPSRYLIHDNQLTTTGNSSLFGDVAGILLFNDTPDHLWIDAAIWNNSIQLDKSPSNGIDVVNAKGTIMLNNAVTGSGWDAIGLYGSTASTLMVNQVSGYEPDPGTGSNAQIYLDSGTSRDLVVCADSTDTLLNQGTKNAIVGCHTLTAARAEISSDVAGTALPRPTVPLARQSPYGW